MPRITTRSKTNLTPWRRLSQLGFLAILGQWTLYGILRCPFAVPFVSCTGCPVITCWGRIFSLFWGFWLLLPTSVLLFGRSFCGWACPGGFANQMLGKISLFKNRRGNKRFKFINKFGIYVGLACALFLWLVLDNPKWAIPLRVGPFFHSVKMTFTHADTLWLIRTITVLAIMASGLVVANIWCRYACPTGGALEIFKRFSLFSVYKTDACNDCNLCRRNCDMGTRPAETHCSNCGDCTTHCPVDAIKIGRNTAANRQKRN